MITNDHLLAGPYALDAIEDDEREAFADHMTGCGSCRQEVQEFRETAALLAEAVAQPVPTSLLDRVMTEIHTTAQLPPLVDEDHQPAPMPADSTQSPDSPDSTDSTVVPFRRRPRARWLLTAAAVLVLVIGAALATTVINRSGTNRADELAALGPDRTSYTLQGDGGLDMTLAVGTSTGKAAVVADGLPALPPGKTYQLWVIDPNKAHPSVVFAPDADGRVVQVFDQPIPGATGYGITVEPTGGSETPTLPVIMKATA